jgi:hypothetical protein
MHVPGKASVGLPTCLLWKLPDNFSVLLTVPIACADAQRQTLKMNNVDIGLASSADVCSEALYQIW